MRAAWLACLVLYASSAAAQLPDYLQPTRTPTRRPTVAVATPRPTVAVATPRPTVATPVVAAADCYAPWPTPSGPNVIDLNYRVTGRGVCFDRVYSSTLGIGADIFMSVNRGEFRRLFWREGCWAYADGTIPYSTATVVSGPIRFVFLLSKGSTQFRAGVRFDPPSRIPDAQLFW